MRTPFSRQAKLGGLPSQSGEVRECPQRLSAALSPEARHTRPPQPRSHASRRGIGQSRSNTFIQGVVVNGTTGKTTSSSSEGTTGASSPSDLSSSKGQFENTYILNKKVVESADLEAQNHVNYLGFYNLSFGYKKKMLKRHFVAFEPFVKLPIKEVTQDNLRLVGAGLRLKVDF